MTFQPTVECGTSWAKENWRVSTAPTPVWCVNPSGESTFYHQLLYETTRCPGLHCSSSEHVYTRNDFWMGARKHGTHLERTLLKPKCSSKIFKMMPYETPTSVAISRTFSRRSPVTSFSTAWQQSSVVASTGRPAIGCHLQVMFGHVKI